jgi:hypothetical protein
VLLESRERAGLTQLQSGDARRGGDAAQAAGVQAVASGADGSPDQDVGEPDRGVGARDRRPSAPYIPALARLLDLEPLVLYEVDPAAPPFTALRLAAELTLEALTDATGISYTSLNRMDGARCDGTAGRRGGPACHGAAGDDLLAAIARDR